jgi:hypothetical protein
MARILTEGFERGFASLWTTYIGSITTVSNTGFVMGGDNCVKLDGSNVYMRRTIGDYPTIYLSFNIRFYNVTATSGNITWLQFVNSSNTAIGALCFTGGSTSRIIRLIRSTTTVATGTTSLALDQTYHIALAYTPHLSSGLFQLYINDVSEINVSGIQTATATNNINKIAFGVDSSTRANFYLDDVIMDTDELITSNHKICTLNAASPSASAPTYNQWSSYDGVSDKADNILTENAAYNYSSNIDEIQSFKLVDTLPLSVDSIHNLSVWGKFTRVGGTRKVSIGMNNDYDDGTLLSVLTPVFLNRIVTLNPSTSASWEINDIADAEVGVKSLSA